jgi:hypothetical protein
MFEVGKGWNSLIAIGEMSPTNQTLDSVDDSCMLFMLIYWRPLLALVF